MFSEQKSDIKQKIVAVSIEGFHCLATTNDGSVFAWGCGLHGRLGLGDNNHRYQPTEIPRDFFADNKGGLDKVVQIAAGTTHSLALTKSGRVYSWGWGEDGMLGLGDSNDRNKPMAIAEECFPEPVVQVQAGEYSSLG